MKKITLVFGLFFVALYAFCAAPAKMYIGVQNAELKEKNSAFAKTACNVAYGAEVVVVSTSGKWSQVQLSTDSSKKGWISTASLSKRKILVGKTSSASASEIALAGKGFNAEVENLYSNSGNANYDAVNKVEKNTVSMSELESFVKAGGLKGAE